MREWAFPKDLRRQAHVLLHQQCWCWGADIRRAAGNLLLAHGFTRTRCPDPSSGSSRYLLQPDVGVNVYLWGFGVAYERLGAGAVFVDRYDAVPILLPPGTAGVDWHRRTDVPARPVLRSWDEANRRRMLFVGLCEWIARYELWVLAQAGQAYRHAVLVEWKKTAGAVSDAERGWRELAWRADATLRSQLWPGVTSPGARVERQAADACPRRASPVGVRAGVR